MLTQACKCLCEGNNPVSFKKTFFVKKAAVFTVFVFLNTQSGYSHVNRIWQEWNSLACANIPLFVGVTQARVHIKYTYTRTHTNTHTLFLLSQMHCI